MTDQTLYKRWLTDLINRRIEGTYWDFKRCHHTNKADLVHDVLCLANAKPFWQEIFDIWS